MIQLSCPTQTLKGEISISGSKSESNRLLIINALYSEVLYLKNLSNSKDTHSLQQGLKAFQTNEEKIDINVGHAGTAMRFLTAFSAIQKGKIVTLTGSERMQNRPIKPLVDALIQLGAKIEYIGKVGYPPLKITGQDLTGSEVTIKADISSQFITALMLIGAKLNNGLVIHLNGELTSKPYVGMTAQLLNQLEITVDVSPNKIVVLPCENIIPKEVIVESDWSSASYWYSIVALAKNAKIELSYFNQNSKQGDSEITNIYREFYGVETHFENNKITLSKKIDFTYPTFFELNLNKTPDIAQTMAVTSAALKIRTKLIGLHTLKIKETDRLVALQNELQKIGTETKITNDSIELLSFENKKAEIPQIECYDDHRMAMSFAPLALDYPIIIKEPEVVVKSYPNFWKDLEKVGFKEKNSFPSEDTP